MTTLDWIIVIVLGVGAVMGFMKGFFKLLASTVGLIAGLLVARVLFGVVGERLSVEIGTSATFGQILAFALIWLVVPVGIAIIASVLTHVADAVSLGFVNRWLGSGLGLLKCLLLVSMFIHFMEFIDPKDTLINATAKQESLLYYPVEKFSGIFLPVMKNVTKQLITH